MKSQEKKFKKSEVGKSGGVKGHPGLEVLTLGHIERMRKHLDGLEIPVYSDYLRLVPKSKCTQTKPGGD